MYIISYYQNLVLDCNEIPAPTENYPIASPSDPHFLRLQSLVQVSPTVWDALLVFNVNITSN